MELFTLVAKVVRGTSSTQLKKEMNPSRGTKDLFLGIFSEDYFVSP
jgi:hypothetical protein